MECGAAIKVITHTGVLIHKNNRLSIGKNTGIQYTMDICRLIDFVEEFRIEVTLLTKVPDLCVYLCALYP